MCWRGLPIILSLRLTCTRGVSWCSGRASDDEAGFEEHPLSLALAFHLIEEHGCGLQSHLVGRLGDRGEGRVHERGPIHVVETHDGDVVWDLGTQVRMASRAPSVMRLLATTSAVGG